ncbi:MAG: DEAD/DEAH box helicase [Deltaproteobacteria bacterium]|nr:DEAD/DEAH box helicase [Deltaproteobacteria bacterium]
MNIDERVLQGVREAGFTACTPVQEKVLPLALAGKNIAAQSQTGTGKTATFLITLFHRLLTNGKMEAKKHPRALILAPTRELVVQINEEAKALGAHTGITCRAIFGGVDYEKQREALRSQTIDVVIATPGRLIDYLKQRVLNLKKIEALVIDEADRMFDLGFLPDLRFILRRCSPYDRRQSLLFSATLSLRVMELAYEHLDINESIVITPGKLAAEKVQQCLYHIGKDEKMALFFGLLARENPERALVFSNTKRMAEILVAYLKTNGYRAEALTGDVPQKKRLSILRRFKEKEIQVLVATDVASRGLHIDNVTHVFNYDLPQDPEDYVHRIGRTARVGATGKSISLASEDDAFYLEPIETLVGKIPVEWVEDSDLQTDIKSPPRRRRPTGEHAGRGRGGGRRQSTDSRRSSGGKRSSRRPGGKKTAAKSGGRTAGADGKQPAAGN